MSSAIALSALIERSPSGLSVLRADLQRRGYARVRVDDVVLHTALIDAIEDATALVGFRFPPLDEPAVYTPARRRAFCALYAIAVEVFKALMHGLDCPPSIHKALQGTDATESSLFGPDGKGHQPFCDGQAFSQSFFNLFNYDGGALNPHVDRSLLTVIRVQPGRNEFGQQSALWVEGADGVWRNADNDVTPEDVLILIGEDCEAIPSIQEYPLKAAAHSVRVDPSGAYIAHSHFRPDPETPATQNRKSAAFILRHEPVDASEDSDSRIA